MVHKIHLDFETRSELDVRSVGASAYARHPSTDVLCLAYAVDDEEVIVLTECEIKRIDMDLLWECPWFDTPSKFRQWIEDGALFIAHNAFFEQNIWRWVLVEHYGFPEIPLRQWRCTAAKAAVMAIPRSLGEAAKFMKLKNQKDESGNRVMLTLSRPNRYGEFWTPAEKPQEFERLYAYCRQDVETERELDQALPDLDNREQEIWFLDQTINHRGIGVDLQLCEKVLDFYGRYKDTLTKELRRLTGGSVASASSLKQLGEWLDEQGHPTNNLQKSTVSQLVEETDGDTRRVLEIRQAIGRASVSKYSAFVRSTDGDGRLRDILFYAGAHTKRWGGKNVQLQNLKRPEFDIDTAIAIIMGYGYAVVRFFYPDFGDLFANCIRGVLIPSKGNRFIAGDFAGIEARVTAWVAGEHTSLELFKSRQDVYLSNATNIYGRTITKEDKDERQVGKCAELALGFGGGIAAFAKFARDFNLKLEPIFDILWDSALPAERDSAQFCLKLYRGREEEGQLSDEAALVADIIKQRWRKAHPKTVAMWGRLESSAILAVQTKKPVPCGPVTWFMWREFLLCKLPSGGVISYPHPRLKEEGDKVTLSYMGKTATSAKFVPLETYGGKLMENVVQAISRDIMADSMLRVEKHDYPLVLTIHDELVSDKTIGEGSTEEFTSLMTQTEEWSQDIPIDVEAWEGMRYRK